MVQKEGRLLLSWYHLEVVGKGCEIGGVRIEVWTGDRGKGLEGWGPEPLELWSPPCGTTKS